MATVSRVVKSYMVQLFGGPEGYHNSRATVELKDEKGQMVALLQFYEPGRKMMTDYVKGGVIHVHFPSQVFEAVLGVLRNEKPVHVYYAKDRGFISSRYQPVGEGEQQQ